MARYVIITNIWGKTKRQYQTDKKFVWDIENSRAYPDYFEKEKAEFDSLDELKDFIWLFEEYCSTLTLPSNIKDNRKKDHWWQKWGENERLWGYLWGDRETRKLTWGGYKLKEYNPGTDKRLLLDMLFRTTEDVPEDYKWDDGEYEGWLQFKWGDGKNAVGYIEPNKPKKEKKEEIIEESEDTQWIDDMENDFLKEEDKEKLRLLANRW